MPLCAACKARAGYDKQHYYCVWPPVKVLWTNRERKKQIQKRSRTRESLLSFKIHECISPSKGALDNVGFKKTRVKPYVFIYVVIFETLATCLPHALHVFHMHYMSSTCTTCLPYALHVFHMHYMSSTCTTCLPHALHVFHMHYMSSTCTSGRDPF